MAMALALTLSMATLQSGVGYSFNVNPMTMANFRAAKANVLAGTGRAKVLGIGDSNTAARGAGATPTTGSPSYWQGAEPLSYLARAAYYLNQTGLPASHNTWLGDGGFGDAMLWDTRVAGIDGTLCRRSSTVTKTLNGVQVELVTTSGQLQFTPTDAYDRIDVFWLRRPVVTANFNVSVDAGGNLQTVNTGGGAATPYLPQKTTVNKTLGTGTAKLTYSGGNSQFIQGINTWNSAAPTVEFFNGGVNGAVAADFNVSTNGWEALAQLPVIDPDLTIIQLIINDSNSGTTTSAFDTTIRAQVTAAKAAGSDVMLVISAPVQGLGTGNYADWLDFEAVLYQIATDLGCGLINFRQKYATYENLVALGWSRDGAHPNDLGYDDEGRYLASVLRAA